MSRPTEGMQVHPFFPASPLCKDTLPFPPTFHADKHVLPFVPTCHPSMHTPMAHAHATFGHTNSPSSLPCSALWALLSSREGGRPADDPSRCCCCSVSTPLPPSLSRRASDAPCFAPASVGGGSPFSPALLTVGPMSQRLKRRSRRSMAGMPVSLQSGDGGGESGMGRGVRVGRGESRAGRNGCWCWQSAQSMMGPN